MGSNSAPENGNDDSDVAFSVGSGFLDAMMYGTPSKKKDCDRVVQESRPNLGDKGLQNHGNASNTIPCGVFCKLKSGPTMYQRQQNKFPGSMLDYAAGRDGFHCLW